MNRRVRYARAICEASGQNPDATWPPTPDEGHPHPTPMWRWHLKAADAAIALADAEIKDGVKE